MNKRTKISLVLVITLILLLGLTIPSLAKKNPKFSCYIKPIIELNDGNYLYFTIKLSGELEADWKKVNGVDTLVNICTGTVPFGEEINSGLSYAEFGAYCTAYLGECNAEETVYTVEEYETGEIWDPDGGYHTATYRLFTLLDTGEFTFYSEYTP